MVPDVEPEDMVPIPPPGEEGEAGMPGMVFEALPAPELVVTMPGMAEVLAPVAAPFVPIPGMVEPDGCPAAEAMFFMEDL